MVYCGHKGVREVSRIEIKQWAKEKIKGHLWEILIPIIIASILTTLTVGLEVKIVDGVLKIRPGIYLGIIFYFVQVGLIYFMTNFINDKEHGLNDLFHFSNDYVRAFLTALLMVIYVFLWTLLLIIPGIIKMISYSLVPYLLGDKKYNKLGYKEILLKSEEMMDGNKMNFFILTLSFIGWHILAIFTLGILEIWIIPYQATATVKFLNSIKENYK